MMKCTRTVKMTLGERSYDITIGSGILSEADKYMNLNRKVAIITDTGVPKEYAETIAKLCADSKIITFPQGEKSKNIDTYTYICQQLLIFGMQKKDVIVAVGGGVVGDISGFCASTYMRGIDFYNVPTTLLSQVDSSIGGKTAIDFHGVKNILGAYYQPKAVLIDTDTLRTLDKRQFYSGSAEIIKVAMTHSEELFSMLESSDPETNIAPIIEAALIIKRDVVEEDERESWLRKVLNFGHTFGHGIEALGEYYHGECVAIGMIPMTDRAIRPRLISLLANMNLPTQVPTNYKDSFEFIKHDKKGDSDFIDAVFVDKIGSFRIEKTAITDLFERIENNIV